MKNLLKNNSLPRSLGVLAGTAVVGFSAASLAQEDIEEVLVWGTEVNSSTFQLDSDALGMRQADHVSDLLRTIPGVDVGGAHSLNQRITIRSMDDKDLRILIDGANQNTYMYHHMGNLQIHADILRSVDIEVGNNSVVNGGLGGAVWFETREAADLLAAGSRWGTRVQGSLSTNGSDSVALSTFGQITDAVDLLVYYNDVSRDNYEVGGGKILDENGDRIDGTDGEVRGLEGDLSDALIKLGWDLNENQRLKFGYETYKDEGDYSYRPDMGLATDLAINDSLGGPLVWPTEFTRDTITLNYQLDWGGHSTLQAVVFQNTSTLDRDETGWASSPAFSDAAGFITGEAENSGINILAQSDFSGHSLTYGAEIINYETDYDTDYITVADESSSEEATTQSVFIEDRIQLGSSFAVIPGIRYNSFDLDSAVVDDTFSDVTGALALEYRVTDNLLLHASGTQLFKGPEIGEVFVGAGLYDDPNPGIKAETGMNTEFAIAYELETLGFGVTIYETTIDDYIYDYTANGKDNVGDMVIDGYEAYINGRWGGFSALLTFSNAESELDANATYPGFEDARIDRQQGDTISLNLDYYFSSIDLSLHWDTLSVDDVDSGPDLDGPTLDNSKDGYTVSNLAVRWAPSGGVQGLQLTVGVDNVFDEFYASQSSRTGVSFHPRFGNLYLQDYEPGRNIKGTVSYQF